MVAKISQPSSVLLQFVPLEGTMGSVTVQQLPEHLDPLILSNTFKKTLPVKPLLST